MTDETQNLIRPPEPMTMAIDSTPSFAEKYQPELGFSDTAKQALGSFTSLLSYGSSSPESLAELMAKSGSSPAEKYSPEQVKKQTELLLEFLRNPLAQTALQIAELSQTNPAWQEWSAKVAEQIGQKISNGSKE